MNTTKERKTTTKRYQISVPMSDFEANRLDEHLFKTGLKKGAFTCQAIMKLLDEKESKQ